MTLTYTIGGVTMTGDAHFVDENSVQSVDALGQWPTHQFRVISKDASYQPEIGAEVIVNDGTINRFGGNIRQLKVDQWGAALISTIGCANWKQLFYRRPTGVRSYTNQNAGDIFQDLLDNTMGSEGLSASMVALGPVIPSFECDFAMVGEAYDTLCGLASDDTNTYVWDCDADKVTRFYRADAFHAPFDITSSSPEVLQLGGSGRISAEFSLDQYTNRVFVRMGKLTRSPDTETFTIGGGTVFTLTFPVALAPTIQVDSVDQTVGILDVDTGKDWYWQEGNPNITRDAGGSGGTTLAVTYQGEESVVLGPYENSAEVAARATAESNLGYYITVLTSDVVGTAADAASRAQAWLDKFSQIPESVTYPTLEDGLRAGMYQDIYWPEVHVDVRAILESVTMTQVNGQYLWTAKAVSGALTGDYKNRLLSVSRGGGSSSGVAGSSGGGTGNITVVSVDTVTSIAADTTLATGIQIVAIDATAADVTATLPTAAGLIGQQMKLYKLDASAHNAVVNPAGTETVDGALTHTLTTQWESITIEAISATEWKIISSAVSVTSSGPAAPGVFTIGAVTAAWVQIYA